MLLELFSSPFSYSSQMSQNLFQLQVILEDGADEISSTEGEEVKMACKVAGYPIPSVRWFKNNSPIHTDIHYNISSRYGRYS